MILESEGSIRWAVIIERHRQHEEEEMLATILSARILHHWTAPIFHNFLQSFDRLYIYIYIAFSYAAIISSVTVVLTLNKSE